MDATTLNQERHEEQLIRRSNLLEDTMENMLLINSEELLMMLKNYKDNQKTIQPDTQEVQEIAKVCIKVQDSFNYVFPRKMDL